MSWPVYGEDEIAAVADVMRSGKVNYWTGRHGRELEAEFASYCGAKYGVALANGTVALELALRALKIGAGDDVVVTARSFFASASCIVACGARPVFADVDADSQNVTAATIEAALTPRTKAVIVVHLAGWPADMPGILALCRPRGVRVIEDCAQAHGASIMGQRVGSFGDAAAFSFCTDKIMSTGGEGGLLVTNDEALWSRAWSYKDHGKSWAAVHCADPAPGFRWLHESFGTNWRMPELQAAIARAQLGKLDRWLDIRARNAERLIEHLRLHSALRVPVPPAGFRHAWYKLYCFVRSEALKSGWDRDRVLRELGERGVPALSGSCPEIYLERAFDGSDSRPAQRFETARKLGETSLMLLVDPCQTKESLDSAAAALAAVLRRAAR
jgi:dTDP-4-amino-4,6-dideoxygalactose transaminase